MRTTVYQPIPTVRGGGIALASTFTDLVLENSIVFGNTDFEKTPLDDPAGQVFDVQDGAQISGFTNVIIEDWNNSTYSIGGFVVNTFEADPSFVDPAGGGFVLNPGSPAIDAGDQTLLPLDIYDLDDDSDTSERIPLDPFGFIRVNGADIDLGAFEQFTPPIQENTLDFDGVDDEVSVAHNSILNPTDAAAFTIEAWVKPEKMSNQMTILFKGNDLGINTGRDNWSLSVRGDANGEVDFVVGSTDGNGDHFRTNQTLVRDKWQHIALSISDFGGPETAYTFYINGQLASKQVLTDLNVAPLTNTNPLQIGRALSLIPFQGEIDEVRIWDTARPQNLIKDDMFRILDGDETGLMAYYNFNQGVPEADNTGLTSLPDVTINGNTGTLNNFALNGTTSNYVLSGARSPFIYNATEVLTTGFTANWDPINQSEFIFIDVDDDPLFGSPLITDQSVTPGGNAIVTATLTPGQQYYYRLSADIDATGGPTNESAGSSFMVQPGHALDFDGIDDYVDISAVNPDMIGAQNNFSIELWANLEPVYTGARRGAIFAINDGAGSNQNRTLIYINDGAGLDNTLGLIDDDINPNFDITGPVIADNKWHHIAYTRDGSTGTLYVDGVLINTHVPTATIQLGDLWSIGQEYDLGGALSDFLDGQIDEVRVWNITRTQGDIQNDLFSTLTGNEPGLIGYYRFDLGSPAANNVGEDMLVDNGPSGFDGTLFNFALDGTNSNWVASLAQLATPADPTGLTTIEISANQIDLNWTDNSAVETGFIIERSQTDNSNFVQIGMVGADVTTYSDNAVVAGEGYFYRVLATNMGVNSNPSNDKFGSTIVPPGNALDFVNSTVDISAHANELIFNAPVTVEFWAKSNQDHRSASPQTVFFVSNQTGEDNFEITIGSVSDDLTDELFGVFLEIDSEFTGGTAVAYVDNNDYTGEWHHYAVVADGSNYLLYFDGVAVTATPSGSHVNGRLGEYGDNFDTKGTVLLGDTETTDQEFDGQLDELRVWSAVRSQAEIQGSLYTPLVGNEANLVAYYRFDQGIAGGNNDSPVEINNLPDRSLNQHDGFLQGFALNGPTSNWILSGAPLVPAGVVITSDVAALTDFYNDLAGPTWTDNTGWLTGDPGGWFGVTTANNRVTGIALPGNNLTGSIGTTFTDLTGLQSLDLSDNNVDFLPDLTVFPTAGSLTLDVRNNLLDFGSLEPNNGISGRLFEPQKILFTEEDVLATVNSEVIIDRNANGTSSQYTWFKDNVEITGETSPTLTFASAQFTDEGTYRAQVTNSIVTDVTLNTADFILKISSLERDRTALTNIFNATGGLEWTDNTNWLDPDVSTWFGVTVENNRVTRLELPNNNLQNGMPTDLRDIGQIELISLENNELRELPDLSDINRQPQLNTLNVLNNRLGFGDIDPNLPVQSFSFAPQRRFGVTTTELLPVNSTIAVSIDISGDNNLYQWFRKPRRTPEDVDGTPVDGATGPTYVIDALDFDNMGIYYVEVTSALADPKLDGFSIRNRNQNVFAVTDVSGAVFLNESAGVPMNDGDILIYEVLAPGQPFELTGEATLPSNGTYSFSDVILGNYLLLGRPGDSFLDDVLQTYYSSSNDWVVADRLALRDVPDGVGINIDMLSVPDPFDPAQGDAVIGGFLESDFPDPVDPEAGLREDARRRVRRAGCSLLRSRAKNRVLQDTLVLVAYTETDDNGDFSFGDIPPGNYFLNIQIPGVPMDTTNLIEFIVDENQTNQTFNVEALALPDAIRLTLIEETGIYLKYFRNLEVYPNPTSDFVTITYEKLFTEGLDLQLLDIGGNVIRRIALDAGQRKSYELDVSQLQGGVYILNFVHREEANVSVVSYRIVVR